LLINYRQSHHEADAKKHKKDIRVDTQIQLSRFKLWLINCHVQGFNHKYALMHNITTLSSIIWLSTPRTNEKGLFDFLTSKKIMSVITQGKLKLPGAR
jgi:hypothetical protein